MKKLVLFFLMLAFQLGLCAGALSAQPPGDRLTGTFSNMWFDEPTIDNFGFEVSVVYTNEGYMVTYQEACGDTHNLQIVKPLVKGNKFTFDVDSACDKTRLHLVAEVLRDKINLLFTNKYVGKHIIPLNRTASFWNFDRKMCNDPCSEKMIASSNKSPSSGSYGAYYHNSTSKGFSGMEVKLVIGRNGDHDEFQGTILVADGGPGRLLPLKPTIDPKSRTVQWRIPSSRQDCIFSGTSYELGIVGTVTCPDGKKSRLILPHRVSYWDLPR